MTKPKGEVSEQCDWVAFTVKFYQELTWPRFVSQVWKEINPIARFTNGKENSQGIRYYWNKTRPNMGKHIILSGSCCTTIGENLNEFLRYVLAEEFTVTRLDLCVDVRHFSMRPERATYLIERGEYTSHAQSATNYSDALVGGYTQYIGKKTSSAYVRIYDKASEMGEKTDWIRIEISYGKRKARSALEAYIQSDDIRGMVRHFVDFETWGDWQKIFVSSKVKVVYEHKETNTRIWIMEVVAKSVAKEMTLDDDHSFYLLFLQRIREEYYALTQASEEITF